MMRSKHGEDEAIPLMMMIMMTSKTNDGGHLVIARKGARDEREATDTVGNKGKILFFVTRSCVCSSTNKMVVFLQQHGANDL